MATAMDIGSDLLTPRPFEARHLGGPVFDCADPDRAGEAVRLGLEAGAVLISCRTQGPGKALEAAGFKKVETLVTLACPIDEAADGKPDIPVRAGEALDGPACRMIAVDALRYDRFHADPRIDDRVADALKAEWIENDLNGRADVTLVVERNAAVAGFCAMLLRPDAAVIDLIAVSPKAQGAGIGRALVLAATSHYRGRVASILVGTQASNAQSLAFYRSLGFSEVGRADTWHWMPGVG